MRLPIVVCVGPFPSLTSEPQSDAGKLGLSLLTEPGAWAARASASRCRGPSSPASAGRALAATPAGAVAPGDIAALQQAFLTGFKGAVMVCAAVAAAGLLATLLRGCDQQRAGVAGRD